MIVIIALVVLSVVGVAAAVYYNYFGLATFAAAVGLFVLGIWGALTIENLDCESLGESYQEDTRFDWMTGCMLPLDDGREIQIDEDSIVFVVRELVEDS